MIRIYDFSYNLLAETDSVLSSEWELKLNEIGTYEGSFPLNSALSKVFAENRYLILCEEDRQAICTGKLISDKVTVYGRTPEWLLSKRIVLPFKTSEIFDNNYVSAESVILYLLENTYHTPKMLGNDGNVVSAINHRAVADDFVIPEPVGMQSMGRHFWRNGANPLSEVIGDLCDIAGCGYSLKFNPIKRCWEFQLFYGEERTTVVSKSLKNAYDMKMKDSILENANGGYFEVYSSEKDADIYGYTEDESIESTGILYWESALSSASGLSEAQKLLKKKNGDDKIESELIGITYGKDYKIGDTLRVQFEAGPFRKTFTRRVTSVSIISSKNGNSIKPVFSKI